MVRMALQIVTNNPDIYWSPEIPLGIIKVEGSPLDVLDKTEELLQSNWRLLSAPLPPNVPIMRGPYRSLVIEDSERQYDTAGLIALDKARKRYEIERRHHCFAQGSDHAVIDRKMLMKTLMDISYLNKE